MLAAESEAVLLVSGPPRARAPVRSPGISSTPELSRAGRRAT